MTRYIIPLLGQSNMRGKGDLADVPANRPYYGSRIYVYKHDGTWQQNMPEPIHDPTNIVYSVLTNATLGVGPGLFIAEQLLRYLPTDAEIGLVPCAKGSTSMDQWARPANGVDTDTLYGASRARWEAALASVPGSVIPFFTYYQGEDETTVILANAWPAKYATFRGNLSTDSGISNVPLISVIIGDHTDPPAGRPVLQTLQSRTTGLGRVKFVDARGLALLTGDEQHLSTASQITLGHRIAEAARSLGAI